MVDTVTEEFETIGNLQVRPLPHWDAGIVHEVLRCYDIDSYKGRKPELIVDIGSHIGSFSRLAASKHPDAKIISVEPSADNYYITQLNLSELPLATPIYGAISNEADKKFTWHASYVPENTGGGGVQHNEDGDIPSILLSDIIKEHGQIDILKSDCEGGEWAWLEDLARNGQMGKVTHIVGEAHAPDWASKLSHYLASTHDLQMTPAPNDATMTLGYFTASLKTDAA